MNTFNNQLPVKTLAMVAACVVALMVAAGCGGTDDSIQPGTSNVERQLQERPVDLLMLDISGSFRDQLSKFTGTTQTVVVDSASRRRTLWAAGVDGSPLRTLSWGPKVDFSALPDQVKANEKLASRFTKARAEGMVKQIEKTIAATKNQVAGSGQLEAMEVAASTPEAGRVFLISDLLTFEVDGINLATATEQQIKEVVNTWLPRLGTGLNDVDVFIVGYGQQAGSSTAARNAAHLFTRLITKAGGRVLITKELPDSLEIGGDGR